jgi:myb proto-oncogene protein
MTGNWTDADEQLLVEKVAELGSRWSAIAQLFPGRTDIGVKNHYISITGRKAKEERDKHAEDSLARQFQADIAGQFAMQEGRTDIAHQIAVKKN